MMSDVHDSHTPLLDANEADIEDRLYRNRVFRSQLEQDIAKQEAGATETQQRTLHDIDQSYERALENLGEIRALKKK